MDKWDRLSRFYLYGIVPPCVACNGHTALYGDRQRERQCRFNLYIMSKKNSTECLEKKISILQTAEAHETSNSKIREFSNEQWHVRSLIDEIGEPWFCLADLCEELGLQASAVMRRLEKDVTTNHPLSTPGGIQQATFVNEDGLYDVILDSRKPEAKKFRKWITSEVLPSIRKSGGYVVPGVGEKLPATLLEDICYIKQRFQEWEESNKRISEKKEALGTMPIRGFYSDTTVLAYAQMRRYEMSYQEFYKVCTKARDIAVRNDVKLKTVPDYGVGDMYIYPCWLLDEVFEF